MSWRDCVKDTVVLSVARLWQTGVIQGVILSCTHGRISVLYLGAMCISMYYLLI